MQRFAVPDKEKQSRADTHPEISPQIGLRIALSIGLGMILWVQLSGCSLSRKDESSTDLPGRILLIGLDGASWDLILPMVQQGKLPHFERLIREGTCGELESQIPMYSPVLWTTIATGKSREKHGITNFLAFSQDRSRLLPVTSQLRRSKAFWNILSEQQKPVDVIGWYVSWPAEPVMGRMVTDHAWPVRERKLGLKVGLGDEGDDLPARVYPENLMDSIAHHRVTADTLTEEDLGRLGLGLEALSEGVYYAGTVLPDESAYTYAQDLTWHRIASDFWNDQNQKVLAVYYNGLDVLSHLIWMPFRFYRYRAYGENPDLVPASLRTAALSGQVLESPDLRNLFVLGRVLEKYYEWVDSLIGEYLDSMTAEDSLMIVTDHGFKENSSNEVVLLPDGTRTNPPVWHSTKGVLIMYGPLFREGYTIRGASILDITPTLLYLTGSPVGRDMDGEVLFDAIRPEVSEKLQLKWIDTYESDSCDDEEPSLVITDSDVIDRLRSLGYIQ